MNTLKYYHCQQNNFIPELIINGDDISNAGFTPGAIVKIEQYTNGLILSLVTDERKIERLFLEDGIHPYIGTDWIRDNGELYLAGEWLTQTGLVGQPLEVSVMPGKVVIRVHPRGWLM